MPRDAWAEWMNSRPVQSIWIESNACSGAPREREGKATMAEGAPIVLACLWAFSNLQIDGIEFLCLKVMSDNSDVPVSSGQLHLAVFSTVQSNRSVCLIVNWPSVVDDSFTAVFCTRSFHGGGEVSSCRSSSTSSIVSWLLIGECFSTSIIPTYSFWITIICVWFICNWVCWNIETWIIKRKKILCLCYDYGVH